jgi:hypothetical protein
MRTAVSLPRHMCYSLPVSFTAYMSLDVFSTDRNRRVSLLGAICKCLEIDNLLDTSVSKYDYYLNRCATFQKLVPYLQASTKWWVRVRCHRVLWTNQASPTRIGLFRSETDSLYVSISPPVGGERKERRCELLFRR